MNLSAPYIQRPIMTTLLMMAILFIGLAAYKRLPVSDLPDVDFPVVVVNSKFPGASPETMANSVALPLEKEFMTIAGIKEVTSVNTPGKSSIVLQFDINKSLDAASIDVQAAISRSKSELPPDLPYEPGYTKVNPAIVPFLYIVLTSETLPLAELYTYANTYIGQRLTMINGVSHVHVHGYPYAVRVQVNPERIADLGISLQEVADTVKKGNSLLPAGELVGPDSANTIVVDGQLKIASAYNPLVIKSRDGAPVRIQDIGKAIDSQEQYRHEVLYVNEKGESQPAIILALQKQQGANTVQLSDKIREYLPTLAPQLPASVKMITIFDKAESIKESVAEANFTLIIAFILVTLVIFLYLGKIRDTLIPALVLPLSIIGTFIVMYLMNYTIDNLSILAFILAMGFIIDDAIVVIENIIRRVEEGESPWVASIKGSQQIGFTILSMTVSLVAVFIPILFMGGLIGRIFREFSVTLITITFISGIISLTLTPMLCSIFVKDTSHDKKGWVERMSNKFNESLLSVYKPSLNWVLDHKWVALLASISTIVLSGYLLVSMPVDFIANDDIGFILAYTQGQEGIAPESMIDHQHILNEIFKKDPNIEQFVSIAAFPQYRNGVAYLRLKPRSERKAIQVIIQELYEKTSMIPGINTFFKNIPSIDFTLGQESKGSYQYTLQSLDVQALYPTADRMINKMYTLPGFQGISSDLEIRSPQINVDILRDQASILGVTAEDIQRTFYLAYSGERISRIETPIDHYNVIVELEPPFQKNVSALSSIYVPSKANLSVPLSSVAKWKEVMGLASISHISQFPATTISFNLKPGVPVGDAIISLNQAAAETLPAGVIGSIKGTAQTFAESFQTIPLLFLFSLVAIYIVLGILYESFIHPITILSTLPPAAFGGLMTLVILGMPFSLYAALGIFMLIGIVKKNGIMVIDYALENERAHAHSPREAIFQACIVRFRPIMMTTMAAIMGAIPIVTAHGMGAEARHPLGYVIIGGLIFAQFITLFVTPCIYLYLDGLSRRLQIKKKDTSSA